MHAVGVAVVGVVRPRDGHVRLAPNLQWREVPLAALVRDALATHAPVLVANEADLAARAEHLRGAAVGVDDVLYVHGEVGVGGGVIVGGQPLVGSGGSVGEVGHMLVNVDGRSCRCGSRGCWETETSEPALLRRAGRDQVGGRGAVADVLTDAGRGVASARAAVDETAWWVGRGLGSLVNVLGPARVVLGGFFALLHASAGEVIERALADHSMSPAGRVDVARSELGIDAPLLGAAELAFDAVLRNPAAVPVLAVPS